MAQAAVILAAGRSSRFREAGLPHKLSMDVWGLPLASYPLISLALAGIERMVIVASRETRRIVGETVDKARGVVDGFPEVLVVVNDRPEWGNGYSFVVGVREAGLGGCLLVSMADHIYSPSIPEDLLAATGPTVGADSDPRYINLEEATRIRVEGGRVREIGKGLRRYTHIDIGVHKIPAEAAYICSRPGGLGFSSIIRCLADSMEVGIVDFRGAPWTEIDTPRDLEELLEGRRRRVLEEVIREWRIRGVKLG